MLHTLPGVFVFAVACAFLAGCGGKGQIQDISGTVTFDGKPVPVGRVYFDPDATRQNDGPQGYADIKDGKFNTREGGKGTVSGAVIARVEGFDGQSKDPRSVGQPLFAPYRIPLDLANEPTPQVLDVPASAPKGLAPPPGARGP